MFNWKKKFFFCCFPCFRRNIGNKHVLHSNMNVEFTEIFISTFLSFMIFSTKMFTMIQTKESEININLFCFDFFQIGSLTEALLFQILNTQCYCVSLDIIYIFHLIFVIVLNLQCPSIRWNSSSFMKCSLLLQYNRNSFFQYSNRNISSFSRQFFNMWTNNNSP